MFTNVLTMGQSPLDHLSIMHACGTCAKGRNGARAHNAILYKIVDELGRIKQAMHDVLRGLYLPYCLESRLTSPLALRRSLGATANLAKV